MTFEMFFITDFFENAIILPNRHKFVFVFGRIVIKISVQLNVHVKIKKMLNNAKNAV